MRAKTSLSKDALQMVVDSIPLKKATVRPFPSPGTKMDLQEQLDTLRIALEQAKSAIETDLPVLLRDWNGGGAVNAYRILTNALKRP